MTMESTPLALPPAAPPVSTPPEESLEARVARIVNEQVKPLQTEIHGLKTKLGKAEAQVNALGKERGWTDEEIAEAKTAFTSYDAAMERGLKAGIPEADLKAVRPGALLAYVDAHMGAPAGSGTDDVVAKVLAALKVAAAPAAPVKPSQGAIGEAMPGNIGVAPTPMNVSEWATAGDTRGTSPGERQANAKQVRDLLLAAGARGT